METRFPPFTVTPAAIRKIEDVGGSVRLDLIDGGCGEQRMTSPCIRLEKLFSSRCWVLAHESVRS